MGSATDAIIGLTGTLVAVKVMSDVALGVRPQRRKQRKRKKMRLRI